MKQKRASEELRAMAREAVRAYQAGETEDLPVEGVGSDAEFTALASEEVLSRFWDTPDEDAVWRSLSDG